MSVKPADKTEHAPLIAGLADKAWAAFWPKPDPDASLLRRLAWAFFRIFAVFYREFQRNNIPLRSSALTFTIVLSLVPTLALGTAVLKGLGAGDQMRQAAYRFIDQIDSSSRPSTPAAVGANAPEAGAKAGSAEKQGDQVTGYLHLAVAKIFDYVERTNFAALGAFGIIGLVLAVISVLGRIEQAMNVIWQAETGRPIGRKLMDYLALMILLPLSVNLGFAAEATLRNQKLFQLVSVFLPIAWLTGLLFKFLPLLIVVFTFSILYRFLPNTKVRVWPALAGGVVGGLSWFLIQAFYVKLQIGVARYNAIYGSFATLPLFLLWLNIAWIVFLSGAEASFACQTFRDYKWRPLILTPYNRLALAFDLLDDIFADFKGRSLSTLNNLVERHHYHYESQAIAAVLEMLEEGGLLRKVEEMEDCYVPAAPVASFKPADVVNLVWGGEPSGSHTLVDQALSGASEGLLWPRSDNHI